MANTVKQSRHGFVFMEYEYGWAGDELSKKDWRPIWREYAASENETRILIGEQTITFEVPADFDPREKQIAALEAKRQEITAKFQAAVTEINARIANLQAITYEG